MEESINSGTCRDPPETLPDYIDVDAKGKLWYNGQRVCYAWISTKQAVVRDLLKTQPQYCKNTKIPSGIEVWTTELSEDDPKSCNWDDRAFVGFVYDTGYIE